MRLRPCAFEGATMHSEHGRYALCAVLNVREHLSAFRCLAAFGQHTQEACEGIAETLLLFVGDEATLSAWGQLVWNETKKAIYGAEIFESPTSSIVFGPNFLKSTRGIGGRSEGDVERADR